MNDIQKSIILLIFLAIFHVLLSNFFSFKGTQVNTTSSPNREISINIHYCESPSRMIAGEIGIVNHDFRCEENNCSLSFVIIDNVFCNADETNFKVFPEIEGNNITIIGEFNDIGTRCVCPIKICGEIHGLEKRNYTVTYIFRDKYTGSERVIDSISLFPNLFCGWSTYGKCEKDEDCAISGCSSQVCQSKYQQPIITTCKWRECYDYKKYGYSCKCVDGKCQWVKD